EEETSTRGDRWGRSRCTHDSGTNQEHRNPRRPKHEQVCGVRQVSYRDPRLDRQSDAILQSALPGSDQRAALAPVVLRPWLRFKHPLVAENLRLRPDIHIAEVELHPVREVRADWDLHVTATLVEVGV